MGGGHWRWQKSIVLPIIVDTYFTSSNFNLESSSILVVLFVCGGDGGFCWLVCCLLVVHCWCVQSSNFTQCHCDNMVYNVSHFTWTQYRMSQFVDNSDCIHSSFGVALFNSSWMMKSREDNSRLLKYNLINNSIICSKSNHRLNNIHYGPLLNLIKSEVLFEP